MRSSMIRRSAATVCGWCVVFAATFSSAFSCAESLTREQIQQRLASPGADFRNLEAPGANLSGIDFAGASLFGANLKGANLSDAKLARCNLNVAILRDALLVNA
ncbi:MAG TPA: pentapeptide repeat-containing protein, partial [Steroidobacteraceae bacterium]|nr:pentapeptide repeat-containing protein [Steroidobacteraceae bacterium]